jgi:multidrug efflux pump subunit AcrB
MDPLIARARWRWVFLGGVAALSLGAVSLVLLGFVQVKMLPFDNKSEFQVILDMPEGTTLEQTTRVARELAAAVRTEPEVRDYQIYAGTAAPFNFNGLVRHYFQRRGPNVADLQVNLRPKDERSPRATTSRNASARASPPSRPNTAPPSPWPRCRPARPCSRPSSPRSTARRRKPGSRSPTRVRNKSSSARRRRGHRLVCRGAAGQDPSCASTAPRPPCTASAKPPSPARTISHRRQASASTCCTSRSTARTWTSSSNCPGPTAPARGPARPPGALRSRRTRRRAPLVPLGELVTENTLGERNLYRKNLRPVTYVTADVAGAIESPAYALFEMNRALAKLDGREFGGTVPAIALYHPASPTDELEPAIKWDGEWHVTLEVFRDLGLAFAAVCILIYMLMVGWFRSYQTPLVIMIVIPFSLIGILPAHALFGAFFTATSMIGFMAGAGIVVRNSIILVDFIELRRAHGLPLAEAVVEAGAVRFRPMLLTALAVVVGASVILADPIFQGLAISLMFGEIASLLISRFAVPVLYFMINQRKA